MYILEPAPKHIPQETQYDCWHASLRMMLKWKHGAAREPAGTKTEWLLQKCREGQAGYKATMSKSLKDKLNPTDIDKYHASKGAKSKVSDWAGTITYQSHDESYKPFNNKPGLTMSLKPGIFLENGLENVPNNELIEVDAKSIETIISKDGPLYCLVSWGHVIVIIGVKDDTTLHVNDPALKVQSEFGIEVIANSPCVARCVNL